MSYYSIVAANVINVGFTNCNYSKAKGKAIPLQAWTGPEGSGGLLRLPDFKTIGT